MIASGWGADTFGPLACPSQARNLSMADRNACGPCEITDPLLTPEQEILFGRAVQRWLSWPEGPEAAPAKVARAGMRARQRLITCNMRLVWSIAGRRSREIEDIRDLVQEGSIGLARAAEKFDPETGYRFSTYATWWIRQSISKAALSDSAVRVPTKIAGALPRVVEWAIKFRRENDREATDEELIKAFRLTPGGPGLLRKAAAARRVISLDSLTEGGTPLHDLVAAEDPETLPDAVDVASQKDLVTRAMPELGPLAEAIVALNLDGWSEAAIAIKLGMPRKDVSANLRRSIDVLRARMVEHDSIVGALEPSVMTAVEA